MNKLIVAVFMLVSFEAYSGTCDQVVLRDGEYVVPVYCTSQKTIPVLNADGTQRIDNQGRLLSKAVKNTLVFNNDDCIIKNYLAYCSGDTSFSTIYEISNIRIVAGIDVKCFPSVCKVLQVNGSLFTIEVPTKFGSFFMQSYYVKDMDDKLLGVVRKPTNGKVAYIQRVM